MSRRDPFLLQHLIVEAAELNPDQTAFIHRESTITYGDLCQRATALASALVEAGIEKGDRVGILTGKSIETAIAVYGIMMAGAQPVYTPPGRLSKSRPAANSKQFSRGPRSGSTSTPPSVEQAAMLYMEFDPPGLGGKLRVTGMLA